jgi:hypothetical protein
LKRRTKKIILVCAILVLAGWIILYIFKGWLLDLAVNKIQHKLKDRYHLELTLKHYQLNGWKEVVMDDVNFRTPLHDTLAYFKHVQVHVKLWPLIRGKFRLEHMQAEDGMMDIGKLRELRRKKRDTEEPRDTGKLARAKRYLGYVKDAADLIPDNFLAKHIRLRYHDSAGRINGYIDSFTYVDTRVSFRSNLTIKNQNQNWIATGTFDKNSLETHMVVKSDVTGFYEFAIIKRLARAEFGFKSYSIDIDKLEDNSNDIFVKGQLKAEKVLVYNPKLSSDTISIPSGGIDFSLRLTDSRVILDSNSRLHLNDLTAMISSDYLYQNPGNIHARLELAPVPAQNIINAMPSGAFEIAKTMQLDGMMGYHLDFFLNIDTRDSIRIDASVINNGVRIVDYGKADFKKLNGTFTYYPYNSRRPILVGPPNPAYTPLASIHKELVDAVVSSEDPNFYGHHGIELSAIESSFLRNLQKGSFRQGGSTITMQLVKNVFLTHKKTIDRKLEEFFLVWLLENTHVTTKSKILEVYLNIIEWGPDVYGIGEASKFYFNKSPSELTLNESIFLAKIIPQPLGFMNRFDEQGNLKENFQKKVLSTVDRLSRHGKIDEETQGSYWPEVHITGPAKKLIKIVPQMDSLRIQDSINRQNDW